MHVSLWDIVSSTEGVRGQSKQEGFSVLDMDEDISCCRDSLSPPCQSASPSLMRANIYIHFDHQDVTWNTRTANQIGWIPHPWDQLCPPFRWEFLNSLLKRSLYEQLQVRNSEVLSAIFLLLWGGGQCFVKTATVNRSMHYTVAGSKPHKPTGFLLLLEDVLFIFSELTFWKYG